MEIKSSIKKLLTCGVVLSGLLGISAIGTNAQNIHADGIPAGVRAEITKISKHYDDPTPKQCEQWQKYADKTANLYPNQKLTRSGKVIAINPHKSTKAFSSAPKHIRRHITHRYYKHVTKRNHKHHNSNHFHSALTYIKGSIKYDKNQIKHDKRILSHKHVRKSVKHHVRKNLKYSYQSLKKMYSFLK